ncbi:MAG: phosphoenolpyruvate carboxykinase (ATP) [Ignavibacteria bacterium GWB2_35_12]|nr:MAG: phosphoenolpyruvate carboxykinase (ATP) [Ignavibacteria bacterium GWB2_35_12]OGU89765.1 MAG: phosphoenolpyruvate carboxykinase (ATP) [Ignavibacteria bacterium RIFOXYA2_FULL_35_10]OGV24022.1 MAG: phosphoenolpyruvate carboxykinase (ATP) [Ignavibacteria bacterium RIFOXYC2_FULL_35_21]
MTKYLEFDTPAIKHAGEYASDYKLKNHGLQYLDNVFWNLPTSALYEEAVFRGEGHVVYGGPFVVNTGKWTARAANDKFIVKEQTTENNIWWGVYNRPFDPQKFGNLLTRLQAFLQGEELFVQDCYVGADPNYRMPIRIITDTAWQSLFARNMFIKITNRDELKRHVPEFTMIASPSFKCEPAIDGTRSETAMIINFSQRLAIVAGSSYGGEVKKTIFTIMNYLKPLENVMAMHCSANVGDNGDVALFFGLSGTGKTTLSADPKRKLIGDDEHGWSDEGVFNFEGGCYAKVIRLSAEAEPEIYACTRRFGTILENVIWDPASRRIDLDDESRTENTRASYPLEFIPNAVPEKMSRTHPKNVIFLTCDATGVLPPIARLDMNQAMYHFISGYTSKIAGTEIGLGIEPEITFSACFGAPFMVHHPFFYANLLRQKMEKHGANCWLVNTGWIGGKFGVGKRISIRHTRNMLNAALDGLLDNVKYRKDKLFNFEVPLTCPGVPDDVFEPSNAWGNKNEYWMKYDALAARYIENFKLFAEGIPDDVINAGPKRVR